jgi:hypothetical protein
MYRSTVHKWVLFLPNQINICTFFKKIFLADLIRIIASYFMWPYRAGFEPVQKSLNKENWITYKKVFVVPPMLGGLLFMYCRNTARLLCAQVKHTQLHSHLKIQIIWHPSLTNSLRLSLFLLKSDEFSLGKEKSLCSGMVRQTGQGFPGWKRNSIDFM